MAPPNKNGNININTLPQREPSGKPCVHIQLYIS